MHAELGMAVQKYSDQVGREISSQEVFDIFQKEFVEPQGPYSLVGYWPRPDETNPTLVHGEIRLLVDGEPKTVTADGNGPISAFMHGLAKLGACGFEVDDYHEQAIGKGADACAVAYVPLKLPDDSVLFGVGKDTNITQAAVRAIIAGLNRMIRRKQSDPAQ
jgi:2-isopropylmalate synthase